MRIAVPVWGQLISPVFDTAETLKIYDIDASNISNRNDYQLTGSGIGKARTVAELANILICGAISNEVEKCLIALGINVHPWVMGESDSIIESYLQGKISEYEYSMPGCQRQRQRRCRRGKNFNESKSQSNQSGNSTVTEKKDE